jgi:hypothetical protein
MKITINGQDYTTALDAAYPLTIERKLNQPSQCKFWLVLPSDETLGIPDRNEYIAITGDDGTLLFKGCILATPLPEYIGAGLLGPRYRLAVVALGDESLFEAMPASAGMTYRIFNGVLSLVPITTVVHALDEIDSSFNFANLKLIPCIDRLPANDVTLCGEREPIAYVTEYFKGDGVTSIFCLADEPYSTPASNAKVISERFDEPDIDKRKWANTGGSYLSLGAGGLAVRGGNGIDGETVLSWLNPVELGGMLLLEALGVTLATGSTGILAAFFDGGTDVASCTAGFQVSAQEGTGGLKLQPLIQGAPSGIAYTANPSNQYALRFRLHSPECYRSLAIYRAWSDSGAVSAGGDWKSSPGKMQFEIQEFVNGVGGMPVTLYDGEVANLPGVGTVVAASSVNMAGTMRAIRLTNLGCGWVVSTPAGGGPYTRRLGSPVEAGECQFQGGGKLQFQAGSIPVVGELVSVSYRTSGRAVGRAVNADNQQLLADAGLPAVSSWVGSVTDPQARCSADCRNAAMVTSRTSAADGSVLRGTYRGSNFEFDDDVWPGDALRLNVPSVDLDSQVIIRDVKIKYSSSLPDFIEYDISFANDWAEDLAVKRSSTVADDAWLSVAATPTVLASLSNLTVTSLNGNTVSINTGNLPPAGGGFEIRRRDFEFMPGTDPGLVTRSSLPNIIFSRETANDRFFIRMYDGAMPPNYSEFSSALFINLPLGS